MRLLQAKFFLIVGIAVLTITACQSTTVSESPTQSSGNQAVKATAADSDPKATLISSMKSLQEVKTWAADVERTLVNDTSPQATMKMQVKYAAPDNFQIDTESGATKLQMISVGGESFLQTNGKWQKAPASLNMEQMINNWRDMLSDQKLAAFKNIEFAGSETINGKDVSVYTYEIDQQAAMPDELKNQMTDEMKTRLAEVKSENLAKIWIDRENNLPAKMEMTLKMSKPQQMTQKMSVNYIFDREIKIEAPKLP